MPPRLPGRRGAGASTLAAGLALGLVLLAVWLGRPHASRSVSATPGAAGADVERAGHALAARPPSLPPDSSPSTSLASGPDTPASSRSAVTVEAEGGSTGVVEVPASGFRVQAVDAQGERVLRFWGDVFALRTDEAAGGADLQRTDRVQHDLVTKGTFLVEALEPGPYTLRIQAPFCALEQVQLLVVEDLAPLDGPLVVRLVPDCELRGRVVDPFGEPVTDGEVVVLRSGVELAQDHIGLQGRFRLRGLAAGALELYATAPGWLASDESRFELDVDEVRADLVLTVRTPASLRGLVTDARGVPVVGATASFEPLTGPPASTSRHGFELGSTTTAADGTFRLRALPSGPGVLRVRQDLDDPETKASTGAEAEVQVVLVEGAETYAPVTLVLPSHVLRLVVTAPAGTPEARESRLVVTPRISSRRPERSDPADWFDRDDVFGWEEVERQADASWGPRVKVQVTGAAVVPLHVAEAALYRVEVVAGGGASWSGSVSCHVDLAPRAGADGVPELHVELPTAGASVRILDQDGIPQREPLVVTTAGDEPDAASGPVEGERWHVEGILAPGPSGLYELQGVPAARYRFVSIDTFFTGLGESDHDARPVLQAELELGPGEVLHDVELRLEEIR